MFASPRTPSSSTSTARPRGVRWLVMLFVGGLVLAASTPPAAAQTNGTSAPRPVQATDLTKLHALGDVQVSPDGRSTAYVVTRVVDTPDGDRPYANRRQIYAVPTSGGEAPRPLTRDEDAYSPAWHPDGDRIAFLRPVDGTPQVFVLALTGGEPYQLTDVDHGASDPQWGPDGRRILFASSLPESEIRSRTGRLGPSERPGRTASDTLATLPTDTFVVLRDSTTYDALDTLAVALSDSIRALSDSLGALRDTIRVPRTELGSPSADGSLLQVRKWLARRSASENPRVTTRLDFQGERDLDPVPSYRHFFVVDVPSDALTGDPPRPTPRAITTGYRTFGGADWLPGGGQVVLSGSPDTTAHVDRVRQRDLYVTDTRGTTVRRLLRIKHHALSDPQVTSDGTTLAFRADDLRHAGFAQTEIGLFALDGRTKPQLISTAFDRDVESIRWSPDGWYLYTTVSSQGGFPLVRFAPFARTDTTSDAPSAPPIGGEGSRNTFALDTTMTRPVSPERLTALPRGVRSFDATDATVVYVVTETSNPYELYANTVRFASERRLSDHNAWIRDRQLATPERFTVESDSFTIEGWVMRPPGLREGQQAPLLVEMHGGPMVMWGPGEATMWHEFQYLAGRGYAIVYANPRGSGGYGRAFKRANYKNWGPGPASDVLAAANYAADLPWTDASRQVLTGGSYAGYLTAWMVSQTNRFRAAAAQRGVYDLDTFFGEGNAWRLVPWHFGGFPWEGDVPPPAGDERPSASASTERASTTASNSSDDEVNEAEEADSDDRRVAVDSARVDTAMAARAALERNSPITYAHRIQTPLLILHADEDLRTGVSQSEMLYRSLKVLGRPVEYVRYPDAGHDLSRTGDPQQRIDRILRLYEFFARYTDDARPTPRRDD